jgi:hypothetical protein
MTSPLCYALMGSSAPEMQSEWDLMVLRSFTHLPPAVRHRLIHYSNSVPHKATQMTRAPQKLIHLWGQYEFRHKAKRKRPARNSADLPFIAVSIFDNEKAWALIADRKVDDRNQAFCKRHELGHYERDFNAKTGHLRLYECVTNNGKKEIGFANGEPIGTP